MTTIRFDLVGFDLDGTLLDTSADLAAAANHVLAAIGRPPFAVEAFKPLIGRGARAMLDRALEWTGGTSPALVDELLPRLLDFYDAHIAVHTAPYPGLLDVLDGLAARGVRVAICTNKRESLARKLLDALDLAPRFAAIIGGDTLGPGRLKPRPDLLLEMIARAGGKRAIFLGDTDNDTGAARAAGVPSIAVSFGFVHCTPQELGADAGIDHYDELLPLLEGWQSDRATGI